MSQINPINDQSVVESVKRGPGRPPKAAAPDAPAAEERPTTLIPVRLLKHYRPRGEFKVIEMGPPPVPGAPPMPSYSDKHGNEWSKLWANTVVGLPRDEVLALLNNEVENAANKIDENGKVVGRRVEKLRRPLAERMDALPV